MKKFSLMLVGALFIGCNSQPQVKSIDVNTELKILKKYNIDKSKLLKFNNNYVFEILETDGTLNIYILDKNYNIVKKHTIKGVIEPKKLVVFKDKLYLLGYDQKENKPLVITLDKNLNELNRKFYGQKFDTPRDILITKDGIIVGVTTYKNGNSIIKIIKNNTPHIFGISNQNTNINFIKSFKDGFIIGGEVQNETGNALIVCLDKNFKVLWLRDLDLGLEENVKKLTIKDDLIITTILSQNYTGMEEEWDIRIDKNGKVLTQNKNFTINDIPLQFK